MSRGTQPTKNKTTDYRMTHQPSGPPWTCPETIHPTCSNLASSWPWPAWYKQTVLTAGAWLTSPVPWQYKSTNIYHYKLFIILLSFQDSHEKYRLFLILFVHIWPILYMSAKRQNPLSSQNFKMLQEHVSGTQHYICLQVRDIQILETTLIFYDHSLDMGSFTITKGCF